MSRQGAATPGVYQIAKSSQLWMLHFARTSNLPRYSGCNRRASSLGFCAWANKLATSGLSGDSCRLVPAICATLLDTRQLPLRKKYAKVLTVESTDLMLNLAILAKPQPVFFHS